MAKEIHNKTELVEAVRYIAAQSSQMLQKTIGKTLSIRSLTVFSHTSEEFDLLCEMLSNMGTPYNYNNGPRVKLTGPLEAGTDRITHLRIRTPDPERPQVGCNDFETDYEVFKREYLPKHPKNLRLIKRPEYEMIEIHDNGFDVLAYVVSHS